MKNSTATTEFQRMTQDELRREILMRRVEYAKMRMGVEMQKEKNHALYKRKRKEIARMSTVLNAMRNPKSPMNSASLSSVSSDTSVASESSPNASQAAKKPVKRLSTKSKKS